MPRPVLFLVLPAAAFFAAFWLLPAVLLVRTSAGEDWSFSMYAQVALNGRYWQSLLSTLVLSLSVTGATLALATGAGYFLHRWSFPGRLLLKALLTLPLSFPGVVVGFMVILLAGRKGFFAWAGTALGGHPWVFAYSIGGLFLGYLYFSIPRVILTVMATLETSDPLCEESARTLGAGPWRVFWDVTLPALTPAFLASGSLCFATAMGAFGTAFTLATQINVLPMVIYDEFTNFANFTTAAILSLVLGTLTWGTLSLGRRWGGNLNVPIS